MDSEITLQIILIKPTQEVVFGLQKGFGSNYETVQKQIPASNDLTFTFTIKVKGWILRTIVYHLFQRIVYQCFSPKFTTWCCD